MSRLLGLSAVLLVACGPSASLYTVTDEGTGDARVTHINHVVGSRYTFALVGQEGHVTGVLDAAYMGRTTLTQGPEVTVYSTSSGDVYYEYSGAGDALQFIWGDDTDVAESPVLFVRLPLKLGTAWTTRDAKGTPFYAFKVEALERVTVPAGTFDAARVVQLNLRQGTQVTRWYAQDVGLVQRDGSMLTSYTLAPEAP